MNYAYYLQQVDYPPMTVFELLHTDLIGNVVTICHS